MCVDIHFITKCTYNILKFTKVYDIYITSNIFLRGRRVGVYRIIIAL